MLTFMFIWVLGKFLFNIFNFGDVTIGIILLIVSLSMLCGCLICLVKVLSSLLKGNGIVSHATLCSMAYRRFVIS